MMTKDSEVVKPEESKEPQKTGFWHIPNAYRKKVRKLTLNEVRNECVRLAGALMDQRNANYVLLQKIEKLEKDLKDLKEPKKLEESKKGQKND